MSTEAAKLLERVEATYAACHTYRDEGVVTTTFFHCGMSTERKLFSTKFVRDKGFLFESRDRRRRGGWHQYAIWTEGEQAKTWWSRIHDNENYDSGILRLAVAGAVGVSGEAAYRIPHYLMPDAVAAKSSRTKPDVRIIDVPEATSQGVIVVERAEDRFLEHIWIDPSSFLVLKIVEPRHLLPADPDESVERLPPGLSPEGEKIMRKAMSNVAKSFDQYPLEVESITTYEPALDVEISPEELIFLPPGTSARDK